MNPRVTQHAAPHCGVADSTPHTDGVARTRATPDSVAGARSCAEGVAGSRLRANRVAGTGPTPLDVDVTAADDLDASSLGGVEDEGVRLGFIANGGALGNASFSGSQDPDAVNRGHRITGRMTAGPRGRVDAPTALSLFKQSRPDRMVPFAPMPDPPLAAPNTRRPAGDRLTVGVTVTGSCTDGGDVLADDVTLRADANRIAPTVAVTARRSGGSNGGSPAVAVPQCAFGAGLGDGISVAGAVTDSTACPSTGADRVSMAAAGPDRQAFARHLAIRVAVTFAGPHRVTETVTADGIAVARALTDRAAKTLPGAHGVGRSRAGNQEVCAHGPQRHRAVLRIPPDARRQRVRRPVAVHLDRDDRNVQRVVDGSRVKRRGLISGPQVLAARVAARMHTLKPSRGDVVAGSPSTLQQLADEQPAMDGAPAPLPQPVILLAASGDRRHCPVGTEPTDMAVGTTLIARRHLLTEGSTDDSPGIPAPQRLRRPEGIVRPGVIDRFAAAVTSRNPKAETYPAAVDNLE